MCLCVNMCGFIGFIQNHSEHVQKDLWSKQSEYEYVNMLLTTLGSSYDLLKMVLCQESRNTPIPRKLIHRAIAILPILSLLKL